MPVTKKKKTFVHILRTVSNRARSRSLFALRSARILEQKRDCSQSNNLSSEQAIRFAV